MLQNFWRPIQVGRIGSASDSDTTATVLSVEAQCVSAFAAVLAPVLGWLVDMIRARAGDSTNVVAFLPVAGLGFVVALAFYFAPPPRKAEEPEM